MCNDVFVKINLKNIGEVRSLIVDRDTNVSYYKDKYLMCVGKYDKNGWTLVFKAKNYKEAEYIIEHTPVSFKKNIKVEENKEQDEELDISILSRYNTKAAANAATLNNIYKVS